MKKFIILLFTILSITVLCSCSGCSNGSLLSDKELDLEDLANIIDSNKNNTSPNKSEKMIEDISRFKITDVLSVNCIKGYPVDEEGMALCEEQTVELIGLGDEGNLYFAHLLLANSEYYAENCLSFEMAAEQDVCNQWFSINRGKFKEKTNEEMVELVKENNSIWIEYGEDYITKKTSSYVRAYIWLKDDLEHNNDNFMNSYNYQMLRGNFCVYEEPGGTKYKEEFEKVNKGENIVLYGGTIEKVFNASELLIRFDNNDNPTQVSIKGVKNLSTDDYHNKEYVSSVIKPGDHVYVELYNDKVPEPNEILTSSIAGHIWKNNIVYNNYDDYMQYNYIALCLKNGELSIDDINEWNKYYDKIMRYHNKY